MGLLYNDWKNKATIKCLNMIQILLASIRLMHSTYTTDLYVVANTVYIYDKMCILHIYRAPPLVTALYIQDGIN